MNLEQTEKLITFLRVQKLAVIATHGSLDQAPESALIAFAEDEQLCLYFQTGRHTRKAKNLQINAFVSFVIGFDLNIKTTVQYEGKAQKITEEAHLEQCKQLFIAKGSPTTVKNFNNPNTIFFKVTPTWIGYSDYSDGKPNVFELKQFK
jgi:general stress protein 26